MNKWIVTVTKLRKFSNRNNPTVTIHLFEYVVVYSSVLKLASARLG